MATSGDFGVNWAVSTITSGPSNSLQVMPTAVIDQRGNICVSWYDTRAGNTNGANNFLLDLYVTFSSDGGASFTPDFQINDVAFDPDLNAPVRFFGPPTPTLRIGEYNGIAASNSLAYAAWTGNDASNMQEIFFDTFPCAIFAAIGGDMIQMETTSILAAGAQYTAAWMIPAIVSAIGIGIVIARKF